MGHRRVCRGNWQRVEFLSAAKDIAKGAKGGKAWEGRMERNTYEKNSFGTTSGNFFVNLQEQQNGSRSNLMQSPAMAPQLEALLTIPKTLAINAALDAIDLLAALRVRHFYRSKTMGP